jgi:hypothetical protein
MSLDLELAGGTACPIARWGRGGPVPPGGMALVNRRNAAGGRSARRPGTAP